MRTLAVYPLNVRSPFRRSKIVYNRGGGEGGGRRRGWREEGNNPTGVFRLGKGVNTDSLAVIRFVEKGERRGEKERKRGEEAGFEVQIR